MVVKETTVEDLSFVDYTARQQKEVSAEQVRQRAFVAKPANQFLHTGERWMPNEYEGFAVVSMVNNNPGNQTLSADLQDLQRWLLKDLDPTAYFLLPHDSFHQTVANTLSDERFKENIVKNGKEEIFPSLVANAFRGISRTVNAGPFSMKLTGVSVFGTAIGVLGLFDSEDSYRNITSFRSQFYNNDALRALDVKMTRPFIGHITLAYIERDLTPVDQTMLVTSVNQVNEKLKKTPLFFRIGQTELRRYHHLAEFLTDDSYPVFHF